MQLIEFIRYNPTGESKRVMVNTHQIAYFEPDDTNDSRTVITMGESGYGRTSTPIYITVEDNYKVVCSRLSMV